jgi:POT family proton-dependent oligopeptide transporter
MANTREKHPKSLRVFFGTEMWERYGFYAVQSLLALYLALHYHWMDSQVYALVGSFTALTYLSPIVGGWIADELIGQKRAIYIGLCVLLLSYANLALFDNTGALTCSLAGVAVGTGLLKPNISSLLGNEYAQGSKRRLSGFTIFYMGITSGIILGTTLPSELSEHFGWSKAFVSAAVGMVFALLIFTYGVVYYQINDYNSFRFRLKKSLAALTLMVFLWSLSFYVLNYPDLANLMFGLVVLCSILYMVYAIKKERAKQARQTLVIGLLCLISVIFWAFYFQMFMSLTLFITRVVQPTLGGILFPAPYYVTLQSIGMLVVGFILAQRQHQMTLVEKGLSTARKFIQAMLFMTLAYFIIVLATHFNPGPGLLSPLLIIPAYLMISLAELLLSPVGLSAITILACKDKVSTMMGIFFVSLGIGGFLSGKLSTLSAVPPGETNLLVLKELYAQAFSFQLSVLAAATLGCLLIYALIRALLRSQ